MSEDEQIIAAVSELRAARDAQEAVDKVHTNLRAAAANAQKAVMAASDAVFQKTMTLNKLIYGERMPNE